MKLLFNLLFLIITLEILTLVPDAHGGCKSKNGGRKCRKHKSNHGKQGPTESHVTAHTSINCPPCNQVYCPRKTKLKCQGGLTTKICGCCPTCAKVKGEECGGKDDYLGKCDKGLMCISNNIPVVIIPSPLSPPTSNSGLARGGICQIANVQDEPPATCKPSCTKEFCTAHPNAICSASNNAIVSMDCRGECQHTGCSACYFQEAPKCRKCAQNDFKCLSRFAKCARKNTCSRNKFPCKKKMKREQNGKFLCWVPECL